MIYKLMTSRQKECFRDFFECKAGSEPFCCGCR